jgi:hypothetical protein
MQQKHLNTIGLITIIFCFGWFSYYFMKEHGYEKELIQKERRMQFLRDSLQAEESRLNIEIMQDAFNVNDKK